MQDVWLLYGSNTLFRVKTAKFQHVQMLWKLQNWGRLFEINDVVVNILLKFWK